MKTGGPGPDPDPRRREAVDYDRWLKRPEYPRASRYDNHWVMDNQMGPNALWQIEWIAESLGVEPGMRVLDLGCGRAMTSIFLAREYGARVWAADLWMSPDHNWRRAREAGVADLVCPLKAEAHALPFAQGFFDAVVSVDAYQYFGSDELYLDYLARFVRPGGLFGIGVVGLMQATSAPPPHLLQPQANGRVFWEPSSRSLKTREFWLDLWRGSPLVEDVRVEAQPDGWRLWRDFEIALETAGKNTFPSDAEALDRDQGRYLGILRLLARRTDVAGEDLYDPSLGLKVGVDS